ncbi:MAG: hypothetical protein AB7N76_24165 [Planctomycetota bacterium]
MPAPAANPATTTAGSAPRALRWVSWILSAACVGFALVSLRYLLIYVRPDLLQSTLGEYVKFPHSIVFFLHYGCLSTSLLLAVLLLRQEHPFAPRPRVTAAYSLMILLGNLFGFYYPFIRERFDVSAWIMLTIGALLYCSLYRAWRHRRDEDPARHREWMALVFSLAFGAAIWRLVFLTLEAGSGVDYFAPGRDTRADASPNYHSAWFLSLVLALLLWGGLRKLLATDPSGPGGGRRAAPADALRGAL